MNDLTVAHGDIRTVNSFPLPVFPYFYLIVLDAVRSVVGETVRSVFDVAIFKDADFIERFFFVQRQAQCRYRVSGCPSGLHTSVCGKLCTIFVLVIAIGGRGSYVAVQ